MPTRCLQQQGRHHRHELRLPCLMLVHVSMYPLPSLPPTGRRGPRHPYFPYFLLPFSLVRLNKENGTRVRHQALSAPLLPTQRLSNYHPLRGLHAAPAPLPTPSLPAPCLGPLLPPKDLEGYQEEEQSCVVLKVERRRDDGN